MSTPTQAVGLMPSAQIITLCGTTKFRAEYEHWNQKLTLAGYLVFSVAGFGHSGDTFTDEQKVKLDLIHLKKILASDAIFVINVGKPTASDSLVAGEPKRYHDGSVEYIGDSTRKEVEWARLHGKKVHFLSDYLMLLKNDELNQTRAHNQPEILRNAPWK